MSMAENTQGQTTAAIPLSQVVASIMVKPLKVNLSKLFNGSQKKLQASFMLELDNIRRYRPTKSKPAWMTKQECR